MPLSAGTYEPVPDSSLPSRTASAGVRFVAMKRHRRSKHRFKKAKRKDQEAAWELRFEQLKAYRRKHGHCQVSSRSKEYPSLGNWVNYQRVLHRSGRLRAEDKRRLDQIGFDWVARGRSVAFRDSTYWDTRWERMLGKLARFHRRFGHCRVPVVWEGTRSLSGWVKQQRDLKRQGVLSQDRWRRLKALGLDWKTGDSMDPRWERSLLRLREFRRRFGHRHVPGQCAENVNLSKWVAKTRRLNRAGRLSGEQLRRLNEVGFIWDVTGERQAELDAAWSKWLAKLQTFHQQHGHWRVPTDQRRFHRLRVWMDNQRISYHHGWLSAERTRRLEKVKFPWVSDRGARFLNAK
jgi:hypothetical protein